jgi:hypothetical protein
VKYHAPFILAAVLTAACSSVLAQQVPQCLPREAMVRMLADRFSEAPVGRGLNDMKMMVEIFASPSGSWTATVTAPPSAPGENGQSCIMNSGKAWRALDLEPQDGPPA